MLLWYLIINTNISNQYSYNYKQLKASPSCNCNNETNNKLIYKTNNSIILKQYKQWQQRQQLLRLPYMMMQSSHCHHYNSTTPLLVHGHHDCWGGYQWEQVVNFPLQRETSSKKEIKEKSDNIITIVVYLELEEISVHAVMLQVVVAIELILFVLPTYCNSPYHNIAMDIMTMPVLQFVILFMDWLPLLSVLIIMKKVNPVLSRDRAKCSKCIYLELYFVSYGWNHAI